MASKRHKKMHFIGTKGRHSVGSHWQGMQGSKPPSRFTQPLMYIISPCQVDVTMFNVQYPTTLLVTTNEPRTIPVLAKVHGPLELLNKGATNGYHMYVYIYIYIHIYLSRVADKITFYSQWTWPKWVGPLLVVKVLTQIWTSQVHSLLL